MTITNALPVPEQFSEAIERFIRVQDGRNRSPQTLRAYRSDLSQLAGWLHNENKFLTDPIEVTTDDLNEFLASLAHRGVSGVSRASGRPADAGAGRPLPLVNDRCSSCCPLSPPFIDLHLASIQSTKR